MLYMRAARMNCVNVREREIQRRSVRARATKQASKQVSEWVNEQMCEPHKRVAVIWKQWILSRTFWAVLLYNLSLYIDLCCVVCTCVLFMRFILFFISDTIMHMRATHLENYCVIYFMCVCVWVCASLFLSRSLSLLFYFLIVPTHFYFIQTQEIYRIRIWNDLFDCCCCWNVFFL